ncbi:AAA-type ATPase [Ceraceosorus bombacis]|uniref:AAA-type ATPase n=1 Tax=Ceraceosorus bombacis TaxID=401625 RepID=A0A0N7L9M0_9BASI|nr:AAA-type ATPase [Ceraceosorus bombacis]
MDQGAVSALRSATSSVAPLGRSAFASLLTQLRQKRSALPQALALAAIFQAEGLFSFLKTYLYKFVANRLFFQAHINGHGWSWLKRWIAAQPTAKELRSFEIEEVRPKSHEAPACVVSTQPQCSKVWLLVDRSSGISTPVTVHTLLRFALAKLCGFLCRSSVPTTLISYELERTYEGNSSSPSHFTRIQMMTRHRQHFEELLCTIRGEDEVARSDLTMVYEVVDDEWEEACDIPLKPWHSVILAEGKAEALLEDVQSFVASAPWYEKHGLPHRRGILLYGPPGTGKTSVATALAGKLKQNLHTINLAGLTDATFARLVRCTYSAVLLLEDIDSIFTADRQSSDERSQVTFSGLLNALDGVLASTKGLIVLASTNHIERIDPALIRPGRFDLRMFVGNATYQQAQALFLNIYTDLDTRADFLQQLEQARQGEACTVSARQESEAVEISDEAQKPLVKDAWTLSLSRPITPPVTPPNKLMEYDEEVDGAGADQGAACIDPPVVAFDTCSTANKAGRTVQDAVGAKVYGSSLWSQSLDFASRIPEPTHTKATAAGEADTVTGVGMAALQGFLVRRRGRPDAAVADVESWIIGGMSSDDSGPVVSL